MTYQIRYHDLGLSAERGCRRSGGRLGLLVLPGRLRDAADRSSGGGRATASGSAGTATTTATSSVLAGLQDLVQAKFHLVRHVDGCGGGDTCGCRVGESALVQADQVTMQGQMGLLFL